MKIRIEPDGNKTLLNILKEKNIYMPAPCAGRGVCGKCKVKVLEGHVLITDSDRKIFSEEELQEGLRLSCKCFPTEALLIEVEDSGEESMNVLGMAGAVNAPGDTAKNIHAVHEVILGIDIGTTTIAMALADAVTGEIVDEYLTVNKQRMHGADVISRIQASVDGKGEELKNCVRQDLWKGITELCIRNNVTPKQVNIAANTTMIHLLMGYPCNTLGVAPFEPYNIEEISGTVEEILGSCSYEIPDMSAIPVRILPGISTFVGADIVADILVCGMADTDKISVLLDLGTNGEMAVGNREKILVTSAAAGPAFEGGNITHGIGSVPGAICGVELCGDNICLNTIYDESACGICGTGVIETMYELLKKELVDETGYMEDEEFVLATKSDGGRISFLQKDVRELQLAKSAIRAGVETLLLRYGVKAEDVDAVYLAGGFGYHINVAKAVGIGLLPRSFADKVKIIGNGSLLGALMCGSWETKERCEGMLNRISAISTEIGLAMDADFNELYMKHMFFV